MLGGLTITVTLPGASSAQQVRRFVPLPLAWNQAVWVAGGDDDVGELFVNPNSVQVHGNQVVLTDPGAPSVVALDFGTGKLVWRHNRRGSGPGEIRQPVISTQSPDGIIVADNLNRRLTLFSRAGRVLLESPSPKGVFVSGLCGLGDGRVLLKFADLQGSGLLVFHLQRNSFKDVPAFLDTTGVPVPQRTFDLARAPVVSGQACVGAYKLADGLGLFTPDGPVSSGKYVERFKQRTMVPPMTIRDTSQLPIPASLGLSVDGNEAFVHFGGTTQCAFRCLDVYALPSLRYKFTYRFEGRLGIGLSSVTVSQGRILLLGTTKDGAPILAVFRLPKGPASQ